MSDAYLTARPSPIRPGRAYHIVLVGGEEERIVADLTWDERPIPRSKEGHPSGWTLRWRDDNDNALTESSDYTPECDGILVNEGGHNPLDRQPEDGETAALENALALTEEKLGLSL